MNKNILFLSISDASGHRQASKAVIKCLEKNYKDIQCRDINFFKCLPSFLVKMIDSAYYSMIDAKPSWWGFLRESKLIKVLVYPLQFIFCFFISLKFYFKFVFKQNVSTVFCTQSFPCICMGILKKMELLNCKLIAIITDYNINAYWMVKNVDYFILPHQEFSDIFIKNGIKKERIKSYGIPIGVEFLEELDKDKIIKEYGILPDKYKVLIMGGSLGMGSIDDVVCGLSGDKDLFLIVICGTNKELYNLLQNKYGQNSNVLIFGYIQKVYELMDISNILVTKPGGITITEALSRELKMVLINPIAGQEEANKDFLLKQGLAFYAKDINSLQDIIKKEKNNKTKNVNDFPQNSVGKIINFFGLSEEDIYFADKALNAEKQGYLSEKESMKFIKSKL